MNDPVPSFDFQEDSAAAGSNPFVPEEAYMVFVNENQAQLTIPNIRIFYLRAYEAKQKLKRTEARMANLTFGTMKLQIMNNHNNRFSNAELEPHDLTLHRVSGFLARYLKDTMVNVATRMDVHKNIINPIAAALKLEWTIGDDIYLSFFPGAEMFMETFKMFPLAIAIFRVQQKQMEPEFLKKHLRQYCGNMTSTQWMISKKEDIRVAVGTVSALPWGRGGLSAAARSFLSEFGIRV
ncbi:N [Minatitlan virus]|uniref:Nucleoprotein n=1 Tax=Minatitlan virus TaxID=35315 RepID=A0A7D9MVK1_9VIRU|nr:N [Minatitlan virus] [Minatitlan virus]QLA46925.1 N [Minatitlan virus] [Minatitlan virus]